MFSLQNSTIFFIARYYFKGFSVETCCSQHFLAQAELTDIASSFLPCCEFRAINVSFLILQFE
ncbi:hypothetical protein CKJ79_02040 [Vibrio coralliilyticus]|nr:hypothetical protein CKJ79_02040 [Vibrio coralliilyticus]